MSGSGRSTSIWRTGPSKAALAGLPCLYASLDADLIMGAALLWGSSFYVMLGRFMEALQEDRMKENQTQSEIKNLIAQGIRSAHRFLASGSPRLVWVFIECRRISGPPAQTKERQTLPTSSFFIQLFFEDQSKARLPLPVDQAQELFTHLSKNFPDISTGWNPSLYQKWKQDPPLLLSQSQRSRDQLTTIIKPSTAT